MRPDVGLYTPVNMLKNVVFPAPFGPIRRTFAATRMLSSSATLCLRVGGLFLLAVVVQGIVQRTVRSFLELTLSPALRNEADRAEQHHQHDDRAVDAELVLRDLDVERGVGVQPRADVRQALDVEPGEDRSADHDSPEA